MPEEKKPEKKTYGGMAVVEGVMMRSPNHYSVACRAPNGKIYIKTEHIEKTWIGRQKWLMKPFLRGTFALLDTMGLGMRAMRIASDVQLDPKFQPEEDEAAHPEKHKDKPPGRPQIIYAPRSFSLSVWASSFSMQHPSFSLSSSSACSAVADPSLPRTST